MARGQLNSAQPCQGMCNVMSECAPMLAGANECNRLGDGVGIEPVQFVDHEVGFKDAINNDLTFVLFQNFERHLHRCPCHAHLLMDFGTRFTHTAATTIGNVLQPNRDGRGMMNGKFESMTTKSNASVTHINGKVECQTAYPRIIIGQRRLGFRIARSRLSISA